jgi:hypothetical protein
MLGSSNVFHAHGRLSNLVEKHIELSAEQQRPRPIAHRSWSLHLAAFYFGLEGPWSGFKVRTVRPAIERPVRSLNPDREEGKSNPRALLAYLPQSYLF